jgi:signal transduction histidine kinase
LRLAPTDLGALAAEIVEACQVAATAKGIALTLETAPDAPSVPADRARLSQVVQNLVDNAVKFSSAGDAVVVRTHRADDTVLLEVSDTGPGLQEDDFARVFSKYGRLSSRPTAGEKSTGLGLAISKQLVQQHRGDIGVRNNPERGATFWFSLPLAGPGAEG